jgi:hypothetical protein
VRIIFDAHAKKVSCALCHAFPGKTHGKVFAVRFLFFAVRSRRTAKAMFPVVWVLTITTSERDAWQRGYVTFRMRMNGLHARIIMKNDAIKLDHSLRENRRMPCIKMFVVRFSSGAQQTQSLPCVFPIDARQTITHGLHLLCRVFLEWRTATTNLCRAFS